MSDGIRVAGVEDIEPGEALLVPAADTGIGAAISVFRTEDDEFFALDDICTHARASLSEGWVEGDQVECPLHAAAFCLRTGKALTLPATVDATTHLVQVRDGDVILHPGVPAPDATA